MMIPEGAIEAAARALTEKFGGPAGRILMREMRDGNPCVIYRREAATSLTAALPALIEAGWIPPGTWEQVGWLHPWPDGTESVLRGKKRNELSEPVYRRVPDQTGDDR